MLELGFKATVFILGLALPIAAQYFR